MCGWAALLGAPVERDELVRAGDRVATRGPDDRGEHLLTGPLPGGLTHRRLAILDPSPAGAQPMLDSQSDAVVVYNGELYNSPGLRRELQAAGVPFSSGTDTEVLLKGWAHWGDRVLDRIEGIFSFALVDQRTGRALLARDRLGVKPLYWAHVDGAIVAGSAPRALLALRPALAARTDPAALGQFLALLWIPHPRTPWADIHKLEPGTAISLDGRGHRHWRYWTAPHVDRAAGLAPAELRDATRQATTRQLLSDVPVGALFSGGLDSSLLLRFVLDHDGVGDGSPLHALTAGYDRAAQRFETVPDDLVYARAVAATDPRVDLTEVVVPGDPSSALAALDALAPHFDDPVADPAALTLLHLCRASRTKVLLSGVGGEELFAGYPRHIALGRAGRVASMPRGVRRLLALGDGTLRGGRPGPAHGLRRNIEKLARAVDGDRAPHYWRMMSQLGLHDLDALVPGLARTVADELDAISPPLAGASLDDALAFDREQFLPNLNLAYVDRASMATGTEVRVPLLDERVVELALAADPRTFVARGAGKQPLRLAATGLVPDTILTRAKTGFGGPTRNWFQGGDGSELRERIEAVADSGLVARDGARRIYADASTGRRDAALAAWALVCLGAWHEAYGRAGGDDT